MVSRPRFIGSFLLYLGPHLWIDACGEYSPCVHVERFVRHGLDYVICLISMFSTHLCSSVYAPVNVKEMRCSSCAELPKTTGLKFFVVRVELLIGDRCESKKSSRNNQGRVFCLLKHAGSEECRRQPWFPTDCDLFGSACVANCRATVSFRKWKRYKKPSCSVQAPNISGPSPLRPSSVERGSRTDT